MARRTTVASYRTRGGAERYLRELQWHKPENTYSITSHPYDGFCFAIRVITAYGQSAYVGKRPRNFPTYFGGSPSHV